MLTTVLVVTGLILGMAIGDWEGGVVGAAVAVFVGTLSTTRRKIRDLAAEVHRLRRDTERLQPSPSLGGPRPDHPEEPPPIPRVSDTLEEALTDPGEEPDDRRPAGEPREERPAAPEVPEPIPIPSPVAAEVPPTTADAPSTLGFLDEALRRVRNYVFGVNTVVQVGVLILLVGIGLLAKWAIDHALFPISLRLAGAALIGVILLVIGWRLRTTRKGYAVSLQGGGVGCIYIVVFFAFRTYGLIDQRLAFAVLVTLTLFVGLLSVLQDAKALAFLGTVGGFLAPVIATIGEGNHVVLFSYYGLLNGGIVGVAWFRAWRELNLLGFAFTFGIGGLWGVRNYDESHYASVQPFLILFVLMFTFIPVLYARRQAPRLKGFIDGTLVFGTPILAFAYQAELVSHFDFGLACSSLGLAALYVLLATLLFRQAPEWTRVLVESFLALGLVFATMTLPLAFDAQWTTLGWSLEGIGLVWVGLRQKRRLPRWSGMLLQIGAALAVVVQVRPPADARAILNAPFFAAASVAIAGFAIAYLVRTHRDVLRAGEWKLSWVFFGWGTLWWFGTGEVEIGTFLDRADHLGASLGFFTGTAVLADLLVRRVRWGEMQILSYALLPGALVHLLLMIQDLGHPLGSNGWWVWPLTIPLCLWILRPAPEAARVSPLLDRWWHASFAWLLAGLLGWEVNWQVADGLNGAPVWPLVAHVSMVLFLLSLIRRGVPSWPVGRHREAYLVYGAAPLVLFSCLWILYANFRNNGDPWPVRYIPLLNPLDIAQGFVVVAVVAWLSVVWRRRPPYVPEEARPVAVAALAMLVFLALNATLLRAIHHWVGVRYSFYPLWESAEVQTSLSIFWTVIALGTMVFATRTIRRVVWIVAACLLGVVVLKLFAIDLSALNTPARIVSFMGVGILMLLVGYLSPVPPKRRADRADGDAPVEEGAEA